MSLSDRWWYWKPWKVTRPWLPGVKLYPEGGDEFCNPTVLIKFPLMGAIIVRYKRGPIRTEACAQCQAEMGPWCPGCRFCHNGPRCHPYYDCDEHDGLDVCSECSGTYCTECPSTPCPGSVGLAARSTP